MSIFDAFQTKRTMDHLDRATRARLAAALAIVTVALVLMWNRYNHAGGACQTPLAPSCHGNAIELTEIPGANLCFVVRARIGTHETVFCIDTGFAGPCLLSLPCLRAEQRLAQNADGGVASRCAALQTQLAGSATTQSEQQSALEGFIVANRCSEFTSGCTMRLASIGMTREQTSDVLLAPAMQLATRDGHWTSPRACSGQPPAELLTTTPMATLHLLTCDWLIQNGPSLLQPAEGVLRTHMDATALATERASLRSVSTTMRGGSFVATLRVNGAPFEVTVDTGAACYLALGANAVARLRRCQQTHRTMQQVGANGEHICSHAVVCTVEFAGAREDVPVLVNDSDVDGDDGYLGACMLRHFDLCLTRGELLARRNPRPFDAKLLEATLGTRPCAGPAPACAA